MALAYGASLGTPNTNTANQATTIALTTSVTVPSGGFLVVGVTWYNAGVTASMGGGGLTWSSATAQKNGSLDSSRHIAMFYAQAPSGLASGATLTATFSGNAFGRGILGDYWTGVATSSPVDQTSTFGDGGGGATGWNGGSVTTTNADDAIVAFVWLDGTQTTNTPTSPASESQDTNLATDPATWAMEYRIVTATGTYSLAGTFAANGGGGEIIASQIAFIADTGGATWPPGGTDDAPERIRLIASPRLV